MWGATGLLAIAACATLIHAGEAMAADSGWVSSGRMKSFASQPRAKGKIPVSIECRNGSSNPAAFKLQVRIVTRANAEKRNWTMVTTDLDYRPGTGPAQWKDWRKVSGKVLKTPGSGRSLYCSLFHHKSADTLSLGRPPVSARVTEGIRTLR